MADPERHPSGAASYSEYPGGAPLPSRIAYAASHLPALVYHLYVVNW